MWMFPRTIAVGLLTLPYLPYYLLTLLLTKQARKEGLSLLHGAEASWSKVRPTTGGAAALGRREAHRVVRRHRAPLCTWKVQLPTGTPHPPPSCHLSRTRQRGQRGQSVVCPTFQASALGVTRLTPVVRTTSTPIPGPQQVRHFSPSPGPQKPIFHNSLILNAHKFSVRSTKSTKCTKSTKWGLGSGEGGLMKQGAMARQGRRPPPRQDQPCAFSVTASRPRLVSKRSCRWSSSRKPVSV